MYLVQIINGFHNFGAALKSTVLDMAYDVDTRITSRGGPVSLVLN